MIIFGKVGQSYFFGEIWHHHALYGQNCPINDSLTPMGVENIVIIAIRAAVSEIQLFLTCRGQLALIITNYG